MVNKNNCFFVVIYHRFTGRVLFPATGYFYIVWESLALMHGKSVEETKVLFKNCKLLRATTISKDKDTKFMISILPGTRNFEVSCFSA